MILEGSRVVRGPDWQWGDQDGGQGHVGTVVTIGRLQHQQCPPGTVKVTWDHGVSQNYRVGYGGQYDLRLLDNGTSGVSHTCTCAHCQQSPIFGIRWTSSQSPGLHLCSRCYHSSAGDPHTSFTRHTIEGEAGVRVAERARERPVDTMGTYPGAVVGRGPDWRFGNQDGGPGSSGVVRDIHDWTGTGGQPTSRSVVSVIWANKEDNMYCRGHKGQIHVVSLSPGKGGRVYLGHLPILGYTYPETSAMKFIIGQHVMVNVDIETLKQMQVGNGGFNPGMMEVLGKRGRVHRLTEKGLVRVQYPGNPPQSHRWALNPSALRVVHGHNVGDQVRISGDRAKVSRYQNTSALESVLGCRGVIKLIHSETSYVIDFGEGKVATLHPGCIEMPREQDDKLTVNTNCVKAAVRGDQAAVEAFLTGTYSSSEFVIIPDNSTLVTCLHQAACKGHGLVVSMLMKYRSGLVNERHEDKTALQIAAHQGHTEVLDTLMEAGADPGLGDRTGDTALHYAAIGGHSDPILALVNKGAEVDSLNNDKRTALHIAVLNRKIEIVASLVKVGADVNVPDSNGDTPFQLSVIQGDHNILDMLLINAALLATNSKGHNVLHIASLKGDVVAVEKILKHDRQMVNIVSREGQSALHLGVSFPPVIQTLIRCPACDINIADPQGRTVLHSASAKLDTGLVRTLVEAGAGVNCQDMLGNTPAHLVIIEGVEIAASDSLYTASMEGMVDTGALATITSLAISQVEQVQLCVLVFLFSRGARDTVNFYGQGVSDLLEQGDMSKVFMEMVSRGRGEGQEHQYEEIQETAQEAAALDRGEEAAAAAPATAATATAAKECLICSEVLPLAIFLPCNHQVACNECSAKMKKCLVCGELITEKVSTSPTNTDIVTKREESWRLRYEDLEEQHFCKICLERPYDTAFSPCGHQACAKCAETLAICHYCRQHIEKKLNLY